MQGTKNYSGSILWHVGHPRSCPPTRGQPQGTRHKLSPHHTSPGSLPPAHSLKAAPPSRNTLHPFPRSPVPARKADFDLKVTAAPIPGCQQAYLWLCCPVIRTTPGREVRRATGETTTGPRGQRLASAGEHPPSVLQPAGLQGLTLGEQGTG